MKTQVKSGTVTVTMLIARPGVARGYEVNVYNDDGSVHEHYSAGANVFDSQAPGENTASEVRKWALHTAVEMFHEAFGRRPKPAEMTIEIEKDTDKT